MECRVHTLSVAPGGPGVEAKSCERGSPHKERTIPETSYTTEDEARAGWVSAVQAVAAMVHVLFTDETNQRPGPHARFFIYGGAFLAADRLAELHDVVERARRVNGFRPRDELKFDTHSRPSHVTEAQHRAAKRIILEGSRDLGVRFVAYLTLHEIARQRGLAEVVGWGLNTVLAAFNRFLAQEDAHGICVVDRLPFDQGFQYLKDKFQVGLTFANGTNRRLDRVHLFAASSLGATHAMSAIDIILGAFRYCVNERRPGREVPQQLLTVIVSMMWHRQHGDRRVFREYGLFLRPKQVRNRAHQRHYIELIDHLQL